MAERQETSVMASINDILRDAKDQEAKAVEAVRTQALEKERARQEALRRQQEEEVQRLKLEEEERQRRAYEEQRRAAELAAIHQATVEKARLEAEAQARHAELASRQAHETRLRTLEHDKTKRSLKIAAAAMTGLLVVALAGGGVAFKNQSDKQKAVAAQLEELQKKMADVERERADVQSKLAAATDPEEKRRLRAELDAKEATIAAMAKEAQAKGAKPGTAPALGPAAPVKTTAQPAGPCTCNPRDPMCTCW
jgi:hypothetical protein